MANEYILLLMLAVLIITLGLGLPLAIALGGIALIFTYFTWGVGGFYAAASTCVSQSTNEILLAVPLFIFMGNMLRYSKIADEIYDMMYRTLGALRGGLAMGTVAVCAIFAAMAGISAVATITMGLVALPSMLKHGYNKHLSVGCIAAAGGLGILIPPSVTMILYALLSQLSVGKLFAAGMIPGIILAILYCIYIYTRSVVTPGYAPALPREERPTFKEIAISFKALLWPLIIILLVLGTIYGGVCTPTEAAAMGALGTLLAVIFKGNFTWKIFSDSCNSTLTITVMAMWIVIGGTIFGNIINALGVQKMMLDVSAGLPGGRWTVFAVIQIIYFILGCFLDPTAIVLICTPIFHPLATTLGFDPIWFATIFIINMQMAYITPPFGYNLFYMRSIVPSDITMRDIYISVVPFIVVIAICLVLMCIFPQAVLWLPNMIIK